MVLLSSEICDFGKKPKNFLLKSVNDDFYDWKNVKGKSGTLVMFICNHCPYVKAVIKDLVKDCNDLKSDGVNTVAIMSNDTKNYPEDSFENMVLFAKENNFNSISYVIDETQEIAKKYNAVCTPDFFGYNKGLKLQYRGRYRELKDLKPVINGDSDLKIALKMIAQTQKGPDEQIPSMGCNIKWLK